MLRTLTAFVLVSVLVPAAFSQSTDWDRRISDIHIVHPPGSPPGTWRAQVQLGLLIGDMAPQPADLSLDITLRINGIPFASEGVTVTPQMTPNACAFTCPSTVCNQLSLASLASGTAFISDSYCYDPPGPQYACNCWLNGFWWNWYYDFVVAPGDQIEFALTARPGSLPEVDTSDDTFSIHVWEQAPGVEFCFGEGSPVACPCGNTGVIGNGCGNSVNAAGANLLATGNGSVSGDTVVLTGSGMPNGSVLYFQGTTQLGGGAGIPFGDGKRCAGGSVTRLGTKTNVAGTSQYPGGGDLPVSVKGAVPAGGGTRTYQAWYRNAAAFCTPATFNLTNGVSIAWQP